jgi:hypothetical protein
MNAFWQRKNKANQSQFRYPESVTNYQLFRGFDCRKGYTALNMKSEFYEFWEVNHEKQ